MARHLALGAFCIEYIEDNWRTPLKSLGGDAVITLNYLPLALHLGIESASRHVLDLVDRERCESVLVYHDWIKGMLSPSLREGLRVRGVPTLAFYPDDELGDWFEQNVRKYDHQFDHLATHCHAAFHARLERGRSRLHYMPWGFNPERWHPVEGTAKRHDILFIGKHKGGGSSATGIEDGHFRHELLTKVSELADAHGWTFSVFGYGWESHPTLRKHWRGSLDIRDAARIVAESRVVLNPAWSVPRGSSEARPQVKLRHFEMLGCEAVQLTNDNAELAALLGVTPLVRYFRDAASLERELCGALDDSPKATLSAPARIARHTISERIASTLASAGIALSHKTAQPVTRWSTKDLKPLPNEPQTTTDSYVHISRSELWDLRIDTAQIALERHAPGTLHRAHLGLDFARHQQNPLHFGDGDGELLYTVLDGGGDDATEQAFECGELTPVLIEGRQVPIESLLIPASHVQAIVAAISEGRDLASVAPVVSHDAYAIELVARHEASVCPREISARLAELGRNAIERIRDLGATVALYGVGGTLGRQLVASTLREGLPLALVVDNARVGKTIGPYVVAGHADLVRSPAEFVLVCAEISGPEIVRQIEHERLPVCVLPLGDLSHRNWATLDRPTSLERDAGKPYFRGLDVSAREPRADNES